MEHPLPPRRLSRRREACRPRRGPPCRSWHAALDRQTQTTDNCQADGHADHGPPEACIAYSHLGRWQVASTSHPDDKQEYSDRDEAAPGHMPDPWHGMVSYQSVETDSGQN